MFDLDEQERIDAIKSWWKTYGTLVTTVLLLVALSLAAFQGWRYYQAKQSREASILYEALQDAFAASDIKKIRDTAGVLMEQHSRTSYAPRAALFAAKTNYQAGDIKSAKAQLQWVLEHAKEQSLEDVARLRLSGIFLDEKNYTEAMKYLDAKHDPAFSNLFEDRRGDVLVAMGKAAEARSAYQKALAATDSKSAYHQLIQVKLDSLGA